MRAITHIPWLESLGTTLVFARSAICIAALIVMVGLGAARADDTSIAALSLAPISKETTIKIRLSWEECKAPILHTTS